MIKDVVEYFVENIGFFVITVLAVGIGVPIIYWAIFEILGLSDIREHLDSNGASSIILPLLTGSICGSIFPWHMHMKKKARLK